MRFASVTLMIVLLMACASKPPAPVSERSSDVSLGAAPDGYYRVQSGDTLYAIAFSSGVDYRKLADWNNLKAPYLIYPGQDIRLTPGEASAIVKDRKPAPAVAKHTTSASAAKPRAKPSSKKLKADQPAPTAKTGSVNWQWPVNGRIIRGFLPSDPARNGIDIAGREGDPVKASAGGEVVYSGNGLIGYGELIIIKHNETWLSAYANNRSRLVSEGDRVQAGQEIAKLGRNDRDEQVLHFEIRANGKPVNPLDQLPER